MTLFLFRLIGLIQIAGGFFGLSSMTYRLLAGGGGMHALVDVLGAVLYAFILVAGVLLVANDGRGQGLSMWAQGLQVPLLSLPLIHYELHAGAFFYLIVHLAQGAHIGIDYHVGTYGWGAWLGGGGSSRIGINLLAAVSWLILKLR